MSRKSSRAVAALAFDLVDPAGGGAPAEFRLMPAGAFRAADLSGRPEGVEAWHLDPAKAAAIVAAAAARQSACVIDFEHQTLRAAENGKPAPAAGWFRAMEWREGDGLYATGVEWTADAAAMIEARQYRYVSPVFAWDRKTGAVLAILHVSLTNTPALDGLTDLAGAAALSTLSALISEEMPHMEELLEQLRWMLNLPVGAIAEEVAAHLQKLIDQLKAGPAQAAASFSLADFLAAQGAEVAALKAAAPDPAKFVPMAQHAEVQNALAALTAQMETAERDGLMTAALSDGRILPAQDAYWRAQPIAALKSYLEVAQPVAALTGTQTGGKKPAGAGGGGQLSEAELAVCRQLGVTPEDFAATASAEAV